MSFLSAIENTFLLCMEIIYDTSQQIGLQGSSRLSQLSTYDNDIVQSSKKLKDIDSTNMCYDGLLFHFNQLPVCTVEPFLCISTSTTTLVIELCDSSEGLCCL